MTMRVVLTGPEQIQREVWRRLSMERTTYRGKIEGKTTKIWKFILTVPKGKLSEGKNQSTTEQHHTTLRNSCIENAQCKCNENDMNIYCMMPWNK